MAEGVGFEPTVRLPVRLISSQVPLTTQPPFPPFVVSYYARIEVNGKTIQKTLRTAENRLLTIAKLHFQALRSGSTLGPALK